MFEFKEFRREEQMTTIDYSRDITPLSPKIAKTTPWQCSDTPSISN